MTKITVSVNESKAHFFMELLRSLNFVKVEETKTSAISPAHKKVIDQELEHLKKHPRKTVSLKQFKKNAEKYLR